MGYLVRPEAAAVGLIGGAIWMGAALWRRKRIGMATVMATAAIATAIACVLPYMLAIGRMSRKQDASLFVQEPDFIRTLPATTAPAAAMPTSRP